jgi:hypothetical protein
MARWWWCSHAHRCCPQQQAATAAQGDNVAYQGDDRQRRLAAMTGSNGFQR